MNEISFAALQDSAWKKTKDLLWHKKMEDREIPFDGSQSHLDNKLFTQKEQQHFILRIRWGMIVYCCFSNDKGEVQHLV